MDCPYCNRPAEWCENKKIYGRNYGRSYMCYYCKPCDAYVGCHKNTKKPLGTLANKELREWRKKAHVVFDPIWKRRKMNRVMAYSWLAKQLGLRKVHIGESDIELCKKIITISNNYFSPKSLTTLK